MIEEGRRKSSLLYMIYRIVSHDARISLVKTKLIDVERWSDRGTGLYIPLRVCCGSLGVF